MNDIVIVGYPKSGTTWATLLVAELVGCPVVGFLDSSHGEIAREGAERQSYFQCYKSHHQLHELRSIESGSSGKIIYIVIDPRDVCLFGAEHYRIERFSFLRKYFGKKPERRGIYKLLLSPASYRVKRMLQAVSYGSTEIHDWVRLPRAVHYTTSPILIVVIFACATKICWMHLRTNASEFLSFWVWRGESA